MTSSCAGEWTARSQRRSCTTLSVAICWSAIPNVANIQSLAAAAACGVPDLYVFSRRQLDRHECGVPRVDERQSPDDRSQQGRERNLRVHPGGNEEWMRHPRRRIAKELLPAGSADAVGSLRDPEGRQRLLHPDHDRSSRLGWFVWCDACRSGELGQGEPRRASRHGCGLCRFDDWVPALLRIRGRFAAQPAAAEGTRAQTRRTRGRTAKTSERERIESKAEPRA